MADLGGFQALAMSSLSETEFHAANRQHCYGGHRFIQLTWICWVYSKHTGEVVGDEKVFLSVFLAGSEN